MAIVVMLVHTYYGFTASGGPAGVGEAVGRAVRASLVCRGVRHLVRVAGHLRAVRQLQPVRVAMHGTQTQAKAHPPRVVGGDPVCAWSPSLWSASGMFTGSFSSYVPVTLTSDRSGLVMETGAKVKLRGVQVGRVADDHGGTEPVSLEAARSTPTRSDTSRPTSRPRSGHHRLRRQVRRPDLSRRPQPASDCRRRGAAVTQRQHRGQHRLPESGRSAATRSTRPNSTRVLSALAEGVRGQGQRIGQATTDANQVLLAVNPRMRHRSRRTGAR